MALDEFNHFFCEAKLHSKERNKLSDDQFGIPSLRKYPLTDEKHVLQAVRFFKKAPEEHKPELARNIVKRAKELNMDWEKWDVLKPYLDKPIKEYAKELNAPKEANDIATALSKIKYDNTSPKSWKLKSPDELIKLGKGNCHDTTWYVYNKLDSYAKRKTKKGILFFIEYKEGKKEGGQTHSVCYEKIPGGICIIECSWQGMTGTFPYNDINEYISVVKNNWKFTGDNDKLYATEIKNTSDIHSGMTLSEYVFVAMKNKEIITESYGPDDHTSGTSDFDHDDDDPDDCYCESENSASETEAFYKRWKEKEGSAALKQAKDIVKKIAKKVKEDEQPPCGNQNCKLCTWCVEAQFRDIDVLPRPLYSPRDPALDIIGETIVKDPVRISIKNGYDGMLEHLMEPVANVARFYCHVNWNNSTGGHEFIILKIGKQNFFIVDAQAGIVEPLSDTGNYFNDINYANSFICRLDNRDFNKELFEKYNDPKSVVPWDGRLDIPYMLEHGMLSEEEAEQYWKEHPDEKPIQESYYYFQEFDHNSEKIPVKNVSFDKLYFGSPTKYDGCIELDRPLFVSPFIGIASIFTFRDLDIQNRTPKGIYNLKYEEWINASNYDLTKPFKDVHVYVEGYPELEPYEIENTGYIHVINGVEYAGRLCRYDWMDEDLEYLIDNSAQNEVHVDKVIECTVRYHVSGKATNNPKLGPYKKNIQEAAIELPKDIWMRKAIKADRDYIFKVEMETLDEKYKNDPKIVDMIRQDAYDSVRKTRIICHRQNQNENETIGLLQAYQKDDYWYIGEIYLEPPFRGKGIARTILEKEISEHDWLSLDVNKNNKHAIDLYLSLGFKIIDENDDGYRMDLKKETIQEGAWNDIKNGVNPFSNKLVYHVSTAGHYDGQVFKPRIPEYLEKSDENDTHFEDTDNPRVCFSPSIEGALNAIIVNLGSVNQMRQLKDLYVYVPEKPLSEYKHRTTKQLVKEKKVFDANITKEIWIEEPVRLKEYGVIRIDQVDDYAVKDTVPNTHGKSAQRYAYSFRWRWVIKPKVLKNRPYDYSPENVSRLIVNDLWKFKYGLIKDGRLTTNASESDYDKYWKLSSPETFDEAGGGNCADFTEWTAGYFDAYGVKCKKYFMDFGNNFHTFVVVEYDKKQIGVNKSNTKEKRYALIDGAIRHISKDTSVNKDCPSLNACFDFLLEAIHKVDPSAKLNGVYDFTNEKIDYGTPMKEYINWIKSHGKKVNTDKLIKEEYNMSDFVRDPSLLKMVLEAEGEENEEKGDALDDDNMEVSVDAEVEIGADVGDIQNEFDPKEVEQLNTLINSEMSAVSEYFNAAKVSKEPNLMRLYSDIGDEERFHLEQLLYAKSTITGETYEPQDPKVKKEYEELLALGMDEETAMTTAVDKVGLMPKESAEEMSEDEAKDYEESFNMISVMSLQTAVMVEAALDTSDISGELQQNTAAFLEQMVFMEEVDNLNTRQGQKDLGTKNPIILLVKAFVTIYGFILNLARKARLAFQKIHLRDKRRWAWIKKHGIGAIFAKGVSMYFYSDKTNRYDVGEPMKYITLIHSMNVAIIKACGITTVSPDKYKIDKFVEKLTETARGTSAEIKINIIAARNTDDGVRLLQGVSLQKTKILVTNENQPILEEQFFGYTAKNYSMIEKEGENSKNVRLSVNVYNQMTILLDALTALGAETKLVAEALSNQEGTQGTSYDKMPAVWKSSIRALSVMQKSVNKFDAAVAADVSEMLKINQGLKEAMETADTTGDTSAVNQHKQQMDEQKKQNAEASTVSAEKKNEIPIQRTF